MKRTLQILRRRYFLMWVMTGFLYALPFTYNAFDTVAVGPDEGGCTITVVVSNIETTKGQLVLRFFKDQKSFEDKEPFMEKVVSKSGLKDNSLTVRIKGVEAGTYGIALLDDENKNKEMDYGLVLPKEGFGFSNYKHTGMSKPKFNAFKFDLEKDLKVKIEIRYM